MNFRVGQKVVRVGQGVGKARGTYRGTDFSFPQVGEVCTIATITEWPTITLITLREHDNSHLHNGLYEPGFDATAFRPVVDRSTDTGMAILRQILADHKTPVKEKALSSFRVTGTYKS